MSEDYIVIEDQTFIFKKHWNILFSITENVLKENIYIYTDWIFEDYFYTEKEYRKLKLDKINKGIL